MIRFCGSKCNSSHTANNRQAYLQYCAVLNIIFSVFRVYIESEASATSLALFAAELVCNSSEDRVSNIRVPH